MNVDTCNTADFVDLNELFPDIDIVSTPFTKLETVRFPLELTDTDQPLGITYKLCPRLHRPFINSITRAPLPRQTLRVFRNKFLGAFIVSIDRRPVFSCIDINNIILRFRLLCDPPSHVELCLAPERLTELNKLAPPPLHLRQIDIENICRIETTIPSNPYSSPLLIHRLQTDGMTPEERLLPSLHVIA
jgi:hypothetical protein